ncbi:MAG: hypothetical protein RLZZ464_2147 [Pseudomonadota bacterium]|jgi:hypothetical protein
MQQNQGSTLYFELNNPIFFNEYNNFANLLKETDDVVFV